MRRVVLVLLCAVLTSGLCTGRGAAQQTESSGAPMMPEEAPDATTYRLRTFVNRIQVPTFVLGSNRMPVPDLPASAFSIRLDSGPAFHPTHARVEGNDPISLGVLIDAAGSQPQLVAQLANALSSLAPDILLQTDSVSIFGADCKMYRTRLDRPFDPNDVHAAVLQALQAVRPSGDGRRQGCEASFRLLDFASYMFMQMKDLPGRRVALIFPEATILRAK